METHSTAAAGAPAADPPAEDSSRRPIRFWPVALILVVFWVFLAVNYNVEMDMSTRFLTRMIALVGLLIAFLTWWLTRRQINLTDRLLAVALWIGGTVIASLISDPTLDLFALVLSTMPIVVTAWAGWAWIARNHSVQTQRAGFLFVLVLVLGYFTLLRWDGLRGDQTGQFSWRWSPSAEDKFLASRPDKPPAAPASDDAQQATPWVLQPGDWAEFRGAQRDGVIRGVRLATDWKSNPPREVWRRRVGPAWSSLIVVDGHVVTQEQRGENEAVVAYDAATGNEQWLREDKGRFYEQLSGAGPRGTPTFHNGLIYTFGASGRLNCLESANGEVRWSRELADEIEAAVPQWGMSASPLVAGGLVYIYGGSGTDAKSAGADKDLAAYRADTGEVAWFGSSGTQSYSSPQLFTFDGVHQIVMQSDATLDGFDAASGELLWQRPNGGSMFIPMLQPHLVGNNRLLVPGPDGFVLIEVSRFKDIWSASDVATIRNLEPSFNDLVIHDGHIYAFRDGILRCIELESGKMKWKKGRYGHGQILLLADQGALLITSESGDIALVAADPSGLIELASFHAIDGKTWNHPVLAHGRLYVRNDEEMACFEMPLAKETPPSDEK
jgi:outer membrane protein assembly factor BamB